MGMVEPEDEMEAALEEAERFSESLKGRICWTLLPSTIGLAMLPIELLSEDEEASEVCWKSDEIMVQ